MICLTVGVCIYCIFLLFQKASLLIIREYIWQLMVSLNWGIRGLKRLTRCLRCFWDIWGGDLLRNVIPFCLLTCGIALSLQSTLRLMAARWTWMTQRYPGPSYRRVATCGPVAFRRYTHFPLSPFPGPGWDSAFVLVLRWSFKNRLWPCESEFPWGKWGVWDRGVLLLQLFLKLLWWCSPSGKELGWKWAARRRQMGS